MTSTSDLSTVIESWYLCRPAFTSIVGHNADCVPDDVSINTLSLIVNGARLAGHTADLLCFFRVNLASHVVVLASSLTDDDSHGAPPREGTGTSSSSESADQKAVNSRASDDRRMIRCSAPLLWHLCDAEVSRIAQLDRDQRSVFQENVSKSLVLDTDDRPASLWRQPQVCVNTQVALRGNENSCCSW